MSGGNKIVEVVSELFKRAETSIPEDVKNALEDALTVEEGVARVQIATILENVKVAGDGKIPMCQDTGTPLVYLGIGGIAKVDLNNLVAAVSEGIIKASNEVPLRKHMVDPLTRENVTEKMRDYSKFINFEILPDKNYLEITVFPKGGGSENMSALAMLTPSQGIGGVKEFVLKTVSDAGGKPCPPTIVGVGIGGTSDIAMKLSKKALLRPITRRNHIEEIVGLEREILSEINKLGIGPMALGGKTTSLAVNIETAPCNTNGLPVAVNMQCWAARRATARILEDKVEYL
ncbi:MAG: fumarate hydratase [Methanobacteriota archaeon]